MTYLLGTLAWSFAYLILGAIVMAAVLAIVAMPQHGRRHRR